MRQQGNPHDADQSCLNSCDSNFLSLFAGARGFAQFAAHQVVGSGRKDVVVAVLSRLSQRVQMKWTRANVTFASCPYKPQQAV